jgi:hypothetical protein
MDLQHQEPILDECIKMCVFLIPCIFNFFPRIYEDIMQIKKGVNINHALNIDLTFVNVKLKYLQMLTN